MFYAQGICNKTRKKKRESKKAMEVGAGAYKGPMAHKVGGTNCTINKNISEAEIVENAIVQA